jgi:DNA-binding transcriptional LysR family regulator
MTTVDLAALRSFQQVAQRGSFTRAAAQLGLDKSKVSRDVRALEASIKAVLLVRSTRSVRLTPEGEALFRRVAPLLAGIEEAVAAVPDQTAIPAGEVVLATTPEIGRELVAPSLVPFRARYPAVRVRVVLATQFVDLLSEGVDLALRVGRPGGGALVARKLTDLTAGFFAAPSYLRRRAAPARTEQLAEHECLWPTPPRGQRSFAPGLAPPPPSIDCADFGLLAEVARSGGGIALLPTFLAARDVAAGALVRLLPDISLMNAPLYLVSRPLRPLPPRVAALRSFLLEALLAR